MVIHLGVEPGKDGRDPQNKIKKYEQMATGGKKPVAAPAAAKAASAAGAPPWAAR